MNTMRKIILLAFVFSTINLLASPYGIMVNGTDAHEGTQNPTPADPSYQEWMVLNLSLSNGSYVQLYDASNMATWAVDLDPASVSGLMRSGDRINVTADGCYSFYIKLKYQADQLYVGNGTCGDNPNPEPDPVDFASAVPNRCSDVMLQAFYWDSSEDKGYGNTKWSTLLNQTDEIGQYFSLVWLPPSSKASGISSKLGYIADDYSNQNSNMGLKAFLVNLISSFHQHHVRVLADIVINHCGNYNSKCNFFSLDFSPYGTFAPNETWITSDDEEACNRGGNKDDGQHDANYAAARDWDHTKSDVQAMCRAYLKWMKGEMKYDGFRFDYCGGYHVKHVNDYVSNAKPYFSVMEYWDGDPNNLKARIDDANKNTLTFDFAQMYTAFQQGVVANNYSKCVKPGLRGKGYEKYAVSFVDNHDTFNRGNDQADVMGKRDGSSINNRSVMLQCNAYILSMPGVPCVFYPHWVKYKNEIKEMIKARWIAGVHSESQVQEESGNGYYKATIIGKTGEIKLFLGPNSGYNNAPSGYTKAYAGDNCGVYYKGTGKWPRETQTDVEMVEQENMPSTKGEKILRDGQLLIQYNAHTYDVFGRVVNQ